MIYTTKRFSVGDIAAGSTIGAMAGGYLGDKIEGGIKKISHNLKYDNNKFLDKLEKNRKEIKNQIKDLENLKRKDPKAYREGLEWGDACDDLGYQKKMLKVIENDIKKTKANPGYGKELSRKMNISTSGTGMTLGGAIGGLGGGLLARKMTKKFSWFGKDKPKPQVTPKKSSDPSFKLKIEDIYNVYGYEKGGCSVVTGKIASGYIESLDEVMIKETGQIFTVESIATTFRKLTDKAGPGDNVCLCLVGSKKEDFKRGMTVCSPSKTKSFSSKTKEEDFREELNDILKKQKDFSAAGREWAGFKSGMKGALKGAKWGAILAPGNLIAAGLGHPKTALGITAAGSLVGGGIGFKLGRDSGISEYKYKNDPEYKKKVDKEKEEGCKKKIKYSLEQDLMMANEFSYKEWAKLAEELKKTGKIIPKELLDYIKFYETTWKKNIKLWYDNVETKDKFEVVEFKEIFPLPISSKTAKEWLQYDDSEDLYIFTVNDAGDDGWVCYNFETKGYGWDGASYGKINTSLKKFISDNIKQLRNDYPLSKTQKELTEKFLRSI